MDNGNRLRFDGLQAFEPDILKIVGDLFFRNELVSHGPAGLALQIFDQQWV